MSNTNRVLNRVFLLVAGLVLLGLGGVMLVALTAPDVLRPVLAATRRELDMFWATPAWQAFVAVVLVLFAVWLAVFAVRRGGGRTAVAFRAETRVGSLSITDRFIREALVPALTGECGIVEARVSVYEVRGTPVVRLLARCGQGTSPRRATRAVEDRVAELMGALGAHIPVFVEISSAGRAR